MGLQAEWLSLDTDADPGQFDETQSLTFTLAIDDIASVVPTYTIPVPGVPSVVEATPLEVPADLKWTPTGNGVGLSAPGSSDAQISISVFTTPSTVLNRPVSLALTAAETAAPVPLVVTGSVLDWSRAQRRRPGTGSDREHRVRRIHRAARPGGDRRRDRHQTIVANISTLEIGVIQRGGRSVSPSEWWVAVADDDVAAYAATLPPDATVTSRVGLAEDLKNDPLRVAIQAALWLVTGAAVVLAALGFAVHAIVTVRAREIEFAQMRAIGVLRGQLLRIVSSGERAAVDPRPGVRPWHRHRADLPRSTPRRPSAQTAARRCPR